MTDPYKGVRDFYPEDERVQQFLFSTMARTVESFGYEPMNASILEPTELYRAKSSEEIVNDQTYTFEDRGGRSVTLRPEMTPTVARMVAARKRELGYPLRLYSIQNFFRYERPQRGRLREFWQLNVDLFGVPGLDAEVEAIVLAHRLLTEFGATESQFEIRVNNRAVVAEALANVLRDPSRMPEATALIDRKEKMSSEAFTAAWEELAVVRFDASFPESPSVTDLLDALRTRGVSNARFDPTIVRGFTYYTGMVFELFDTSGDNTRSLFGGGRYDTLVEKYGGEPVPAVGFAVGDVVLKDFLETHHLLPTPPARASLYLIPFTDGAAAVADALRATGVNVALGMKHEKIADHIRAAEKLGITYVAVYGENEARVQELALKHLGTGTETKLSIDKVHAFLVQS